MTTSEPPTPRRALPAQDTVADPAPPLRHRPSRAIWPDDEPASTPVPPPAPVLPSGSRTERAGRRFSAESASEGEYTPRRSAASVSSPPAPHDAPDMLDAPTRVQPRVAAARLAEAEAGAALPGRASGAGARSFWADRRQRLLTLGIVGVAVLALVIGLVIASQWGRGQTAATTPGASVSASAGPSESASTAVSSALLDVPDLAALVKGAAWTVLETLTTPTANAVRPLCLPPSNEPALTPASRQQRSLGAGTDGPTLLHVQDSFPTAAAATAAYTALLTQLGGCDAAGGLITSGYQVAGLADQAAATSVTIQETAGIVHTVLISRTGTEVDVVDAARPKTAIAAADVAKTLATALQRQCSAVSGTCPGSIKVTAAPPPAGAAPGWLAEADLPRVTVGAGRWGATAPGNPDLVGSQCESIDLNAMPGASKRQHRTYLLADDKNAPSGFGVDEAVYTFGKSADATAAAKKITNAIDTCRERTRTATVKTLDAVKTTGADGKALTGSAYAISQRIDTNKSVLFRVAVGVAGNRLVYLLANPSSSFDFSDNEWEAVTARALQRAGQAS